MNWRSKVNRRLFVVPSGIAPEARVRVDYPELGLAVAHLRVGEVPDDAITPGVDGHLMLDAAVAIQPAEQVIVVTGHGLESDDKLAATRVIDRGAIERSASGRMEDVLRDVAGLVSFRRSDSRSAHPTSQGTDPARAWRQCREPGDANSRRGAAGRPVRRLDRLYRPRSARDRSNNDVTRRRRRPAMSRGRSTIDSRPVAGGQLDASLGAGSRSAVDARLAGRRAVERRVREPVGELRAWRRVRANRRRRPRCRRPARAIPPRVGARRGWFSRSPRDRSPIQSVDLSRPTDARHRIYR